MTKGLNVEQITLSFANKRHSEFEKEFRDQNPNGVCVIDSIVEGDFFISESSENREKNPYWLFQICKDKNLYRVIILRNFIEVLDTGIIESKRECLNCLTASSLEWEDRDFLDLIDATCKAVSFLF